MPEKPSYALARVRRVLDRLLDPESGCPWDLKQTPATIRLYLLEETYELLDAVEADEPDGVKEELGDCFFILCFLARLFEDQGLFDVEAALNAAADKIIFRHPHVFGEGRKLKKAEEVQAQWHEIKKEEKGGSLLQGIPKDMPALLQAHRLTQRAGQAGFDWDGPESVMETLDQEINELKKAVSGGDREEIAAEFGDVLFSLANLGRHLKVNAEEALRGANDRFTKRFQYIEDSLANQGRTVDDADLIEMDRLWAEAKDKGL